jgi:hypothetical protein
MRDYHGPSAEAGLTAQEYRETLEEYYAETTLTPQTRRRRPMTNETTTEVDWPRAMADAEWLAGSTADTAERNLARAYLELRNYYITLTQQ